MKMTAKYRSARQAGLEKGLSLEGNQDDLYKQLNEAGLWWDSKAGAWINFAEEPAEQPSPKLMIRVWAAQDKVDAAVSAVIKGMRGLYTLIDRSDPYPCRPPKQKESRVYLTFLPDPGKRSTIDEILRENAPLAIEVEDLS